MFHDEHAKLMFFFCTLGFMLQWVGPLWVMVQFPHINLSSQIENKKPFVCIECDKNLKLVHLKLILKKFLLQIRINQVNSQIAEKITFILAM